MELFNLKGNVISSGNQYYFVFFKNKHIFEKTHTIVFSEIFFNKNLCHIETIQMTGLNIIQYFTGMCFGTDFSYSHRNKLQNYACLILPKQY